MFIRFISIFKAILSRIYKIHINNNFISNILASTQWVDYTLPRNIIIKIPKHCEHSYNIAYRIYKTITLVKVANINGIYFYPMPYSFYYEEFNRFLAGLAFCNFEDKRVILGAKYSIFKPEIYPYIEHEVLHAIGLLKSDHSNWETYKNIAKYK